jgi:hypothetical protein
MQNIIGRDVACYVSTLESIVTIGAAIIAGCRVCAPFPPSFTLDSLPNFYGRSDTQASH